MDFSKLKVSDWLVAGGGLILFIASFLPWFTVEVEGFGGTASADANGWDVGFLWAGLPALIGLIMVGYVVVTKLLDNATLPELPVKWSQAVLGLAALAALLVILKLLIGEDDEGAAAFGIEVKRAWGLFLATLAALAQLAGAFLKFQEGDEPGGATSAGNTPPTPF